ncbi:MAG: rhomboid family intramembrane serine protease [Lachnospiraceae bacterium]|nr:rhomboid family intramembrane serine protease [Lachnospiraceae bacterium]
MLNHIVELLYQKGYRSVDEKRGMVLIREAEQMVYIVMLGRYQNLAQIDVYKQARRQIEFMTASRYRKPVRTLCLMLTKTGMFDEEILKLVEELSGVWLVAEDTGRVYVFENQSEEFDGLYGYLEQKIPENPGKSILFTFTPVNMAVVVLNIIYFLAVILLNKRYDAVYDSDIMLKMGALSYKTFVNGAWCQIVTSLFMHFGFSHLFNNMLLLVYAGCELEKRIGSFSYLILYLVSGILGNAASLWYYNHIGEAAVSAGASGAIFGVVGALIIVLIANRTQTDNLTPGRLLFLAAFTIYNGITTMGVDNAAHIGGFISGIIGGFLLSKILQYGKLK